MFFFFFGTPEPGQINAISSELNELEKTRVQYQNQLNDIKNKIRSNDININQLKSYQRFLDSIFNPKIQGKIFISESKRANGKPSIMRYYCRFIIAWPDWPIPGANSKLKPFKYTVSIARVDDNNFSGIDDPKLIEFALSKIKTRINKELGNEK